MRLYSGRRLRGLSLPRKDRLTHAPCSRAITSSMALTSSRASLSRRNIIPNMPHLRPTLSREWISVSNSRYEMHDFVECVPKQEHHCMDKNSLERRRQHSGSRITAWRTRAIYFRHCTYVLKVVLKKQRGFLSSLRLRACVVCGSQLKGPQREAVDIV
jgi:hypothetical protein